MVGGLGDREGGSGTLTTALGAGNLVPKTGSGTERLFKVFRPRPSRFGMFLEGNGVFWALTDECRADRVGADDREDFGKDLNDAGEGFLTVTTGVFVESRSIV